MALTGITWGLHYILEAW